MRVRRGDVADWLAGGIAFIFVVVPLAAIEAVEEIARRMRR